MKISTRGRYALRMMVEIAMHDREEWVSIKDISERQGISVKYLEQIVTNLTKSGLLLSSRGPRGGYMLAKNPDEYAAGEILRVIEGELAPVACLESGTKLCERRGACPTSRFWEGLHQVINEDVDSVALQDLLDFCEKGYGYDYSI